MAQTNQNEQDRNRIEIDPNLDADDRRVSERKYQIKTLWGTHQEMLRRAAVGQSPKAIAWDLEVTTATVGNVINSELGKKAIAMLQSEMNTDVVNVGRRIKEIAPDAIKLVDSVIRLHELSEHEKAVILQGEIPDLKMRVSASLDILDRAGYMPVKKVAGIIAHGIITGEDLDEIKKRSTERLSLSEAQDIEDATSKDINKDEGDNDV